MDERIVKDVYDDMKPKQKDMLHLLIGITLMEGSFKAYQRMGQIVIGFFTVEESRVVSYLIDEARKKS